MVLLVEGANHGRKITIHHVAAQKQLADVGTSEQPKLDPKEDIPQ